MEKEKILTKISNDAIDTVSNKSLVVNNIEIQLTEIEPYYYKAGAFEDESVHRNERQQNHPNQLYIHRRGKSESNSYYGGTRCGIDICLSDEEGLFYTYLIRSIKIGNEYITGPNKVFQKFKELFETEKAIEEAECKWVRHNKSFGEVLVSKRIGLTKPENGDYNDLNLRFVLCDDNFRDIKYKGKEKMILDYLKEHNPKEGRIEFCKKHLGYCLSDVKSMQS